MGAKGDKTGKTAVLPGFCKIEGSRSGGAPRCYRLGHLYYPNSAPASIDICDQAEMSVWIGQPDQIKSKNPSIALEEKKKNFLEVPNFRRLDVTKLPELVDHEDKIM